MKKVACLLGLFALAILAGRPVLADCGCAAQQVQQVIAQPQVQYVVAPQVQRVIVQPQYQQVQRVIVQQQVQRVVPHVQQVVVQRQVVAQPQVNVNVNRGVLGLRQNVNVRVR